MNSCLRISQSFGTLVQLLLCRHVIGRGMETDTKYSHFLDLGTTGMILNKSVIRNITYALFEYIIIYVVLFFLIGNKKSTKMILKFTDPEW